MKISKASDNLFFANNLDNLAGMQSQKLFFRKVFEETVVELINYYQCFPPDCKEHGFQYGEEQMKTFLTPAISRVTKGYLLQECPIDRKKNLERHKDELVSTGRLDYWATYGNSSFLIEMKHHGIRYYPRQSRFTFYQEIENGIVSASKQLDEVSGKTDINYGRNLFGISLVVSPVFVVNEDIKTLSFDNKTIQTITQNCKNKGSNIVAAWSLENELLFHYEFETENGKQRTNYYPALIFIGKIKKYSKG